MSVLAHLVTSMGEPGATQALAYILNQQSGIVQAFVNLLGAADIRFEPRHRVESERGDDGGRIPGRPDMKIYPADGDGNPRVLVENKFWAGLTDAQPVEYLKMLPEDVSSGLLFIVPRDRVKQMWNVLKTRCHNASLHLGQESPEGARVRWVPMGVGTKRMLITDWQNVLDALDGAADGDEIRCDLFQLRRLVEKLEGADVFLPLGAEEVANVDVAQRMMNYIDLLNSICNRLPHGDMGITCENPALDVTKYRSIHRSLKQNGHGVGWLAISFYAWHRSGGITPLWWWMSSGNRLPKGFDELENLFEGVHVCGNGGNKFIPIRLKLGVEREVVVEDAVQQIRAVFEKLT